jgi:predicted metal-dependent enzyme (double-stranded beta helix superfamily)
MHQLGRIVALVVLCGGAAARQVAQAPSPDNEPVVAFGQDPHSKSLLYTAHLRMYDVTVAPGDSTLDHSHDHDVVAVALGDATLRTRETGGEWGAPRSHASGTVDVAGYTGMPGTHRRENVGMTPYHVYAVENLRDAGWSMPRLIDAPGTRLAEQSRSFAVYDVRLNATTSRTSHVHQMPTVVILISGAVEVQGGGGESEFRMQQSGRWFPSQWDQPHTLTLIGTGEAHVVEVEVR